MENAGKRRRSGFEVLQKDCKARVEELRAYAGDLKFKNLADGCLWRVLMSPDILDTTRRYAYMGREFTGSLIRFILKPDAAPLFRSNRPESHIKYVSGTPGFGRTVSLKTSVLYLYLRSIEAMEEKQKQRIMENGASDSQSPSPQATTDVNALLEEESRVAKLLENPDVNLDTIDISKHRFVLFSARQFTRDWSEVLYNGLVMAYIKDPETLAGLEALDCSAEDHLVRFLRRRPEKVNIIIYDGDAFEPEDGDTPEVRDRKNFSFEFLLNLQSETVKVIICAPTRAKLQELVVNHGAESHLGVGGFTEDEVCKFISYLKDSGLESLKHLREEEEPLYYLRYQKEPRCVARRIYRKTGWVPGLVFQYLSSEKDFEESIARLQRGFERYLREEESSNDVIELLMAMAGRDIEDPLCHALNSGCYYRGSDGRVRCLTPWLHAWAIDTVLRHDAPRKSLVQVNHRIMSFAGVMLTDKSFQRAGWNSIAATLLALKLLRVRVPGVELLVAPDLVRTFSGRLRREVIVPRGTHAVLYVPEELNHTGADACFVSREALVVFRITASSDAGRSTETETGRVARALFKGEESKEKVLVVVRWGLTRHEQPSEFQRFHEIHTSFGGLDASLGTIDERLEQLWLGREQGSKKAQGGCKKWGEPPEWRCTFCGSFFEADDDEVREVQDRKGAPHCLDCRLEIGFREKGKKEDDELDRW